MRSIRSELYLFCKKAIMGGTYSNDVENINHVFEAIPGIKQVDFWNSQLINAETIDSYKCPAVFFEYTESERSAVQQKTSEFNTRANSKDVVNFTFHVITGKYRAENSDVDYLEAIDLTSLIYNRLQGARFLGVQGIFKVTEVSDSNSQTLMDYQIIFETELTNCADGDTIDARTDPAPQEIPFVISAEIQGPEFIK